ncbi:MAG TPA: NUDIX domain-containing protein [Candidatus Elarobacter sp.]|nr:NUDIX domain-containing protein [Candidatus Elarobacter sp.]
MNRPAKGKRQYSVDVIAITPRDDALAILLERRSDARNGWTLPWSAPQAGEGLDDAARRVTEQSVGSSAAWMTQIGAFSDGRHPSDAELSVAYVALVPMGTAENETPSSSLAWFSVSELPPLSDRQSEMVQRAITEVRDRLDLYPVAFRLLPPAFTLSELQQMYELLLGRRLHKASFRRALQAAWLVEPTDEWRSEGRGRPAQLYRYSPRKRRRGRRGVRFDLLG